MPFVEVVWFGLCLPFPFWRYGNCLVFATGLTALFFAIDPCWARYGFGGDSIGMHTAVVALAERIRSEGWLVWNLDSPVAMCNTPHKSKYFRSGIFSCLCQYLQQKIL
jgi:hypothetical protein